MGTGQGGNPWGRRVSLRDGRGRKLRDPDVLLREAAVDIGDEAGRLNRAGWYLMRERSIWYDRVPNEYGDMVWGPYYEAVSILARLAYQSAKPGSSEIALL